MLTSSHHTTEQGSKHDVKQSPRSALESLGHVILPEMPRFSEIADTRSNIYSWRLRKCNKICGGALFLSALLVMIWQTMSLLLVYEDEHLKVSPDNYRMTHIPLDKRRQIFRDLTASFPAYLRRAQSRFPGHPWSIADDFHYKERLETKRVAHRYRLDKTVIYMILDEGIREAWLGADGKPLPANTPPLRPRISYITNTK